MQRRPNGRPRGSIDRRGAAKRVDTSVLAFTIGAFAAQIRHVREEANISASELAAAIGYKTATIHRYERGDTAPSLRGLVAIAMALRVPVEHLVPEV